MTYTFQKIFPLYPGNDLPFLHIHSALKEYILDYAPIGIGDTHKVGRIYKKAGTVHFLWNPAEETPDDSRNQKHSKGHQAYPAMMIDNCYSLIKLLRR